MMITARLSPFVNMQSLIVGILMAAITLLLLYLGSQSILDVGISQIFVVISGMTTMAALSAFSQSRQVTSPRTTPITFNLLLMRKNLTEGLAASSIDGKAQERSSTPLLPWDMGLSQFVGIDNSLALAKLRIELERELRRIAYSNQVNLDAHHLGAVLIAKKLATAEILPGAWLDVIRELVAVCNQAIHGSEVSDSTTSAVVSVGEQLLEQLQLIAEGGEVDRSQNRV